jgi:hypothetical protein
MDVRSRIDVVRSRIDVRRKWYVKVEYFDGTTRDYMVGITSSENLKGYRKKRIPDIGEIYRGGKVIERWHEYV